MRLYNGQIIYHLHIQIVSTGNIKINPDFGHHYQINSTTKPIE